jgi:hypothetical protein
MYPQKSEEKDEDEEMNNVMTNVRNVDGIEVDLSWKRTNPSIECVSHHRTCIRKNGD